MLAAGDIRRKVLRQAGGFAMLAAEAFYSAVISSKFRAIRECLQDLAAADVFLIGIGQLMTNQL